MDKRFLGILIGAILVLVGVFVFTAPKDSKSVDLGSNGDLNTVQTYDHVRGKKDSKVILIEYGDFQCPGCLAFFPTGKNTFEKYGDKIAFVYRHFPLTKIHPNAMSAARAAEAAAEQDKFWEMHDKLFETRESWANNAMNASKKFESLAKDIGLDMNQFKSSYASSKVNDRINASIKNGTEQGVTATPTLFLVVDGKSSKINPPNTSSPTDPYFKAIEEAVKKTSTSDSKSTTKD